MRQLTDTGRANAGGSGGAAQGGKPAKSAVGKAFAILRVLRRTQSPLKLTAIASEVDMAASSAHSVLNQLVAQGAVVQDSDKHYRLGPEIFYIGSAFARGTAAYRSIWMELVSAANELGVTTALAVPWDSHHLVLNAHRAGESDVAVQFGARVPLGASSWGKVHYAWSGDPLPESLVAYTAASIVDRSKFDAELKRTRELGYAVDQGELSDGVGGVAAPVTSDQGYEGLASFMAPLALVNELSQEIIGRRIAGLAARASLALGDESRMRFFGTE